MKPKSYSKIKTAALLISITVAIGMINSCSLTSNPTSSRATNHPPVLTLLGNATDTVTSGVPYIEAGVTAIDQEDGNLTDSIYYYDGTFNRTSPVAGSYSILYFVADRDGVSDTIIRTIVVINGTATQTDTIAILNPVSGASVYSDTSKVYKITASGLTIPSGASITFAKNVHVVVLSKIYVLGTLTVDTGAVFLMASEGSIQTYTGQLNIRGSDPSPVFFANLIPGVIWGVDPVTSSNAWASYGIEIGAGANANSSIEYCVIDSATTGINIRKDGLLLSHIAVMHSKYTGIYFDACGPKDSLTFRDIYLVGNGSAVDYYPLSIGSNYLGRLSDSLIFTANAVNAVQVVAGTVTLSGIWKSLTVPYVVTGGSYIRLDNANGVVVTVAPGAQFKFTVGTYIDVYKGTFIANGSPTNHIGFDAWVAGTYWGYDYGTSNYLANHGIYFELNATAASSVSYCDFNHATQGVASYDSPVQVSNCTFSNSKYYGLYATTAGKAGINVASCTFSSNGAGAYYLQP